MAVDHGINGPVSNSYWVTPKRLAEGEHPGATNARDAASKLRAFLKAGASHFIDLTVYPQPVARSNSISFAFSAGSTMDSRTCWSILVALTAEFAASTAVDSSDSLLVATDADSAAAIADRADFAAIDHKNSAGSESSETVLIANLTDSIVFVDDSVMAAAIVNVGPGATSANRADSTTFATDSASAVADTTSPASLVQRLGSAAFIDSADSAAAFDTASFFAVPLAVHANDAATHASVDAISASIQPERIDENSAAASSTILVVSTSDNATIKV